MSLEAALTRALRGERVRRRARRAVLAAALSATLTFVALRVLVARGELVDPARFARPDDALVVVDRHDAVLRHARVDGVDRRWVPLAAVSTDFIHAVVATEDARFYAHRGVDGWAIARSAARDLAPWTRLSGASTITQQLVKRVYGRDAGLWSKALEALRAMALERVFTKDEILEQYVNRIPFGDHIEGIERASEEYFGKPASALTVAEAALLAGVPQAPSATEPRRHFARATARRDFVLGRMRAVGYLDERAYRAALAERTVVRDAPARPYEAPRFVDWALGQYRAGAQAAPGGVLATTLDLALEQRAQDVLASTVDRFAARGVRNGAVVVVGNATGEVLAYVGAARPGDGSVGGQLDLVRARREPGSSLKPFVYELLFERGGTPATLVDDLHVAMTGARGASFEARDYDGHERGPVRARTALASSLNLAALDAARRVGAGPLLARLRALGLGGLPDDDDHYGAAVVLGGADVSPFELAGAYATLARGGTRVALTAARTAALAGETVMHPAAAALALDVLSDGAARADAFGSDLGDLAGGAPFALKTGTSSGWHDAWASVVDERFTVVVWLGNPAGGAMAEVSGFEAAAPVAARILAAARARAMADAVEPVARPRVDLVESEVCASSGLLAGPRCRHVVRERFARGSSPREVCALHDAQGRDVLSARYAAWIERVHPANVVLATARDAAPIVPRVRSPHDGARFLVDVDGAPLPLRATVGDAPAPDARWEIDGAPVAGSQWPLVPGEHEAVAVVAGARSRPAHFAVESASRAASAGLHPDRPVSLAAGIFAPSGPIFAPSGPIFAPQGPTLSTAAQTAAVASRTLTPPGPTAPRAAPMSPLRGRNPLLHARTQPRR